MLYVLLALAAFLIGSLVVSSVKKPKRLALNLDQTGPMPRQ